MRDAIRWFKCKLKPPKIQRRILKEQEEFYKELYSRDTKVIFNMVNKTGIKISDVQRELLDSEITKEEIKNAIFDLKKGKVPGCDGLPMEFYVTFINHLLQPLYELFIAIVCKGKMSISMRKGLISLLPKKLKDPTIIKNLCPLTLLNSDYKVLATIMATRLKTVLPDIIGEQQTGFMANHSIHTNIRKTMDIIAHLNTCQRKTQAVIVSIDFEKCFDRIEHESIFSALKYFNFGDCFIDYV